MFINSLGKESSPEESIFPLLSYDADKNKWKCLGTGFFIQGFGGFITAKHVFPEKSGVYNSVDFYAVHTTSNNERHIRSVKHFVPHPKADIIVGFLGNQILPDGNKKLPEIATAFKLDFEPLNIGDNVRTYAFPLMEKEVLAEGDTEFTFSGKWATGNIVEFHQEGSLLLRNKCYETTMIIEHGASGGPVLKNNLVIGINSSGEIDPPVSYITPIDLILELSVPENGNFISIKDLVDSGTIKSK